MVDSRFGKPSNFVHLSDVQCTGEESKLSDCVSESFTQQDSTSIVDHIDVAGVICAVSSNSVSTGRSTTTGPTRTTAPTAPTEGISQSIQIPLYGVIGAMAVLLVVGLIVIIM